MTERDDILLVRALGRVVINTFLFGALVGSSLTATALWLLL